LRLIDTDAPTFSNITTTCDTADFHDLYSTQDNGYQSYVSANYTTAHNSSNAIATSIDDYLKIGQDYVFGFYYLYRSYVMFDTSSLSGLTINSAEVWLYTFYPYITGANFSVTIQNGINETYPHIPLVLTDWNQSLYYGNGGSFDTANIATGVRKWNVAKLNNQGIGWINTAGTTKFTLKSNRDLNYTEPTGHEYVIFYSKDSNLLYSPRLIINAWNGTASNTYSLSCIVNDNWNVSKVFLHSNNTGIWTGADVTPSTGWINTTAFMANASLTLNSTANIRIEIYWWINDTSNMANQTMTYPILTMTAIGRTIHDIIWNFYLKARSTYDIYWNLALKGLMTFDVVWNFSLTSERMIHDLVWYFNLSTSVAFVILPFFLFGLIAFVFLLAYRRIRD
jgi:hypothetical protein